MGILGEYILSVTCAAILCGVMQSLLTKNSVAVTLLRLIGGLFLAFTVVSPVMDINLDYVFEIPSQYAEEGKSIVTQENMHTQNELRQLIKSQCETYIEDKALSYQAPLDVEITLNNESIPAPESARLRGDISPYVKGVMQTWLAEDMGIPREHQIWIS